MKNDFFDFVESERFASRIGDGTISGLNNHVANAAALAAKQAKVNDAITDSILANSCFYDLTFRVR